MTVWRTSLARARGVASRRILSHSDASRRGTAPPATVRTAPPRDRRTRPRSPRHPRSSSVRAALSPPRGYAPEQLGGGSGLSRRPLAPQATRADCAKRTSEVTPSAAATANDIDVPVRVPAPASETAQRSYPRAARVTTRAKPSARNCTGNETDPLLAPSGVACESRSPARLLRSCSRRRRSAFSEWLSSAHTLHRLFRTCITIAVVLHARYRFPQ
jgi:hypothetical protein